MRVALALFFAPLVTGHARMVDASGATPRTGISGGPTSSGTKLTPFDEAATYALQCGGREDNNDPGVERPLRAFSPGDQVTVTRVLWVERVAQYHA